MNQALRKHGVKRSMTGKLMEPETLLPTCAHPYRVDADWLEAPGKCVCFLIWIKTFKDKMK